MRLFALITSTILLDEYALDIVEAYSRVFIESPKKSNGTKEIPRAVGQSTVEEKLLD